MRSLRLAALAIPLSLPACHLVDQRDFDPSAGLPPKPTAAPVKPLPPAPALITIRFGEPNPPYQTDLTDIVHKALARKPDARFTVSTTFAKLATPAATADAAALAAADGRGVAQTIVEAGAAPAQVEQEVAASPAATVTEVRVLVR